MTTLTVGSGQQFSTLSSAIAASHNGDTIQVQAGTYVNDFATISTNISIIGVGGMVNLVCTQPIPNGKAILVTDADVTMTNIAFSGAQVADHNGAGIRQELGNLTLNNCYFHDNQEGVLTTNLTSLNLTINNSEFANNGFGDGYSHNLYAGTIGNLVINDSYFFAANVGHEIKSRALNTTIENSFIADGPSGTASYSIDLPNGGNAIVTNNIIEQGPNSQNPAIIEFGGEGNLLPNTNLSVSGNLILNDKSSPSVSGVLNFTTIAASITGNAIYGLTAGQIAAGPSTQSGNTLLASEPYPASHWTAALPGPWLGYVTGGGTGSHAAADFNGDGRSDILWRNDNGTVVTYEMNGTQISGGGQVAQPDNTWHIAGTGDFNGDGKGDILWRNDNGSVAIYELAGTQIVGGGTIAQPDNTWHVAGTGDFNGDGKSDILWRNDNGTVVIYEMNGTQIIGGGQVSSPDNSWQIAGVGDFDGDGKSDILWRNTDGRTLIYEMNGTQVVGGGQITAPDNSWQVAGVGDFNGDGKSDILWRNTNSTVVLYQMNGTQVTGGGQILSPDNTWHVAATGDFNGDGKSDILWRNDNGAVADFQMNGTQVLASGTIAQPNNTWHIAA